MSKNKTLNALLTAGLIGAAALLPAKKSEAQQNTMSVFYGGGAPPLQNFTLDIHGWSYPLEFNDTEIFGFRLGRRRYWDARKINPELEIEAYISKNTGERISYLGLLPDSTRECEFGEETRYGRTSCRELGNPALFSISAALLGLLEVRPSQKINRLSAYAGGGPFVRWSWFSLLDKRSERRNYGFELQTGVRWGLGEENDGSEIFLEYSYDKTIPDFSREKIRNVITLNRGTNKTFSRTLLGARVIF
ncbi:MAG: hypothetical protein Q8P79_02195 [Nanoarchaeota archaeon]|nr:hypothetical protein [Nanoarchaeota archaeon]